MSFETEVVGRARGAQLGLKVDTGPQQDRQGRAPPGDTFTNLFRTCQVAQEKASSYHFLSGRMGFLFCFQGGWDWAGEATPLPQSESCPVNGKRDRSQGV